MQHFILYGDRLTNSFIYAGDKHGGLWLNTTGIGSNSTPQISNINVALQTTTCHSQDSVITFTFFDSCNGIQAKLVSASLSGSNNFSLISPSNIPRTIHPNDSIIVRYQPSSLFSDNATLHLRFHLGWKDFDTVISLSASINPVPKSQFTYSPLKLKSALCKPSDSVIIFSFSDSCTGTQATLLSADLQGSGSFSFSTPSSLPRVVHPSDSIRISYNTQSQGQETARLTLHFRLGLKDFDTVITLSGDGRLPAETVSFIPTSPNYTANHGSEFDIAFKPDKAIADKGLDSITFDLVYNADLLDESNRYVSTNIPNDESQAKQWRS